MGATAVRNLAYTRDGNRIYLDPVLDKVEPITTCTVVCDSPRCEARHGQKTVITYNEELAYKDATSLPSGFEGIIRIIPDPFEEKNVVFLCSAQCAKDYLTYAYIPPKTAKERLAESRPDVDNQTAEVEEKQ